MRGHVVLAALLLPLSGCYVAPQGPAYVQPGYPAGYVQPGYASGPYDAYGSDYPGYSYTDGSPTRFVDGSVMPLVMFGGSWGYYDRGHSWHRAPDALSHRLEQQRAMGGPFRPNGGGFQQGRPEGRPGGGGFSQPRPEGRPAGGLGQPGPFGRPAPGGEQFHGQPAFRPTAAPAAPRPAPPREEHNQGHDCRLGERC